MRTGTLRNISVGAVLTAVVGAGFASIVGLVAVPTAGAQIISEEVFLIDQAGTLIMPFDNTENHASFQIVSRLGSDDSGPGPVATHWSYWADDCRHLVDVIVCLTPLDTKVMDPAAVQGELQSPNPPTNNGVGSITDLTGERGMVTVTAFEATTGASGLECDIADTSAILPLELSGGWVIADTSTTAAFGADALGLAGDAVPDASLISTSEGPGIFLSSFNPQSLGDSAVIVLTVKLEGGNGRFTEDEIGPIAADMPDGNHVCCNVTFTDHLEITTSLPDLCLECVGFNPISALQANGADVPIIPANTTIDAPGFVRLSNCESLDSEGQRGPLIEADIEQFLFAIHGQAIGPFGAAVHGKYSTLDVF